MYTLTFIPNNEPANDNAEPHCPAPVSVTNVLMFSFDA